jgi:hypothetical protein
MNLFELDREKWEVVVAPQVYAIAEFKAVLKKDKSKDKSIALKEMSFIYFYCDIKSDYMIKTDLKERVEEIKKDLELPATWKPDKVVEEAIEFYQGFKTMVATLYEGAIIAAGAVNDVFKDSKKYIEESDDPIKAAQNVLASVAKVPGVMRDLNTAHQELVKEQKLLEGRFKGSREMSVFEEGLL